LVKHYLVAWGTVNGWRENLHHGGSKAPHGDVVGRLRSDDPDETAAAFERGREYVKTGKMP
jgi:hypothetical protein